MFTFENIIPTSLFGVTNGNVHLHESASTNGLQAAAPVNIIQDDQTAYAHFVWKQTGWLASLISPKCKFECTLYVEAMGKAEVNNPPSKMVSVVPVVGQNYSSVIPISGLAPGVYKLVGTLLFHGPTGTPTPIAAFDEVGYLTVYADN